jgi:DtxR family Mn-dependent transcriptional regulator
LSDAEVNKDYKCIGVKDSSTDFLKYLDKQKIALGSVLKIVEREEFDETLTIAIDGKRTTISNKIASNLYVQ